MDDAALEAALGEHCLNGLHYAVQSVCAEQINIHDTPGFQVVQHIQPKFT